MLASTRRGLLEGVADTRGMPVGLCFEGSDGGRRSGSRRLVLILKRCSVGVQIGVFEEIRVFLDGLSGRTMVLDCDS